LAVPGFYRVKYGYNKKVGVKMANIVFYRCKKCGSILALFLRSGEIRNCCGQSMDILEPNTIHGTKEKHIPVVVKENDRLHVSVGATLHPMQPEHYIECITIDAGNRTETSYLKTGMVPKAEFSDAGNGTVYAYCNIHGLWEADF
jgi:superoxide reductase